MILRKWNYDTHEYEPFESPAKAVVLYTQDMDLPINCSNCGKDMTYGEGLTSKTIHNPIGLGYPVCEDCYEQEIELEKASK